MIAAKYRLFSAEPKASKFPRYAHTVEAAVRHFDLGRRAISPGWSAIRKLSGNGVVGDLFRE
jgi:hypothetical protein